MKIQSIRKIHNPSVALMDNAREAAPAWSAKDDKRAALEKRAALLVPKIPPAGQGKIVGLPYRPHGPGPFAIIASKTHVVTPGRYVNSTGSHSKRGYHTPSRLYTAGVPLCHRKDEGVFVTLEKSVAPIDWSGKRLEPFIAG